MNVSSKEACLSLDMRDWFLRGLEMQSRFSLCRERRHQSRRWLAIGVQVHETIHWALFEHGFNDQDSPIGVDYLANSHHLGLYDGSQDAENQKVAFLSYFRRNQSTTRTICSGDFGAGYSCKNHRGRDNPVLGNSRSPSSLSSRHAVHIISEGEFLDSTNRSKLGT